MKPQFLNRNIISISDLNKTDIDFVLSCARFLKKNPKPQLLRNKVMGSCFFEPSTRTRLSFETAMNRLGGTVVGFADAGVTSAKKGETIFDTIKIIGQYVDVIAMRHPIEGSARKASESTDKPVINGGDGSNQHPTQTLLDLFTITECQGKLNNLHIAIIGDLKYGRTVHSLVQALIHFNATLYFISPDELKMPKYICDELKQNNIKYSEHDNILEIIDKVDIGYVTRIQQERFADQIEYERVKNIFVLNSKMLENVKNNLRILHPLPRVNEISIDVDNTKYAYYFQQAQNGLYVRQALLGLVTGKIK